MSEYYGEDWFIVEGKIEHFQWSEGHENLLEQINHRARAKSAVAGAAAAAAAAALNMYGTLATSAMVAMYDGEYTENFACVINDKVVCGTFCGARKLQNGDQVKVVVSSLENGVLYAHAVQRPKDELLWMPSQVFCGDKAALKEIIRSSITASIICWVVVSIVITAIFFFDERRFNIKLWIMFLIGGAVVSPIIGFAGDFFPSRVGKEFGEIGSKIFSLLGFPDSDDLSMQGAGIEFQTDEERTMNIYMYRLALDAHASGTKIITRFDRARSARKQRLAEAKWRDQRAKRHE